MMEMMKMIMMKMNKNMYKLNLYFKHHNDESDDDSIEKEVKQYDLSGDL